MIDLWRLGSFIRSVRSRMKYGDLSRSPLRLLRVQWTGESAECDWMARPPDTWDSSLPKVVRQQHASLQALKDAMALRGILFSALPDVHNAELRAFRQSAREPPHLIIIGTVTREAPAGNVRKVASIPMKAKLYGFKFWMDDGVLGPLETVDRRFGFAT
jgi:hypothetical protein